MSDEELVIGDHGPRYKSNITIDVEARYLQRIAKLEKVVEAAREAINTVDRVYSGVPGKLDWPGYHQLKQALEDLDGEK